jgi:hypothetical protein
MESLVGDGEGRLVESIAWPLASHSQPGIYWWYARKRRLFFDLGGCMAKVLVVHGISNQYLGEAQLHSAWFPALCDGLRRAGIIDPPNPEDCFCPFYGDLFRPEGMLSGAPAASLDVTDDELLLLQHIWESAAATDDRVPGPKEFEDTLVWAPRIVERALASLSRSKHLAGLAPLQFLGDLRQVAAYLNDPAIRNNILESVLAHIQADTRVVIGHSLGSVIAYEAIAAKPGAVSTFLTLGSPLGIRNIVFKKLTPAPVGGRGQWPGRVQSWTNIAARGDIVAAEKQLAPLFGSGVTDIITDIIIDSGWDAHSARRYLDSRQAGAAIASGLT